MPYQYDNPDFQYGGYSGNGVGQTPPSNLYPDSQYYIQQAGFTTQQHQQHQHQQRQQQLLRSLQQQQQLQHLQQQQQQQQPVNSPSYLQSLSHHPQQSPTQPQYFHQRPTQQAQHTTQYSHPSLQQSQPSVYSNQTSPAYPQQFQGHQASSHSQFQQPQGFVNPQSLYRPANRQPSQPIQHSPRLPSQTSLNRSPQQPAHGTTQPPQQPTYNPIQQSPPQPTYTSIQQSPQLQSYASNQPVSQQQSIQSAQQPIQSQSYATALSQPRPTDTQDRAAFQNPQTFNQMNRQVINPSDLQSSPQPRAEPVLPYQAQTPSQHPQDPARFQQQESQQSRPAGVKSSPSSASKPRVMARVEIPMQPKTVAPSALQLSSSPKRKHSDGGPAVPVCESTHEQSGARQMNSSTATTSSSHPGDLQSLQGHPSPQPSTNYYGVLLGLADEYVRAARGMDSSAMTDDDFDNYHALISTAMGCLQAALFNFRQADPRKEARIRILLSSLLIEETENDVEVEEILSKGIALCNRSRLTDLKYSMNYLLAQLSFKSSPKRAFKAIDTVLQEVETLKLYNWIYAFHFLWITLSMQLDRSRDTATVLKHLSSVSAYARDQRHVSVQIFAAVLETMVHLSSGSADAIDLAQSALASARTHQLGPDMQKMPQVRALMDCLDLSCSLIRFQPQQAIEKMTQMNQNFDLSRSEDWSADGTFSVDLGPTSNQDLHLDTGGIMNKSKQGMAMLTVQWVNNRAINAVDSLLSGLASIPRNNQDGKARDYVANGQLITGIAPDIMPQSLTRAIGKGEQHKALDVAMQLHMIFVHCSSYEWEKARQQIKALRQDFAESKSEMDETTAATLNYQEAICRHGLGDIATAVQMYRSPDLQFNAATKNSGIRDLQALATLNSVMIIRTRPGSGQAEADKIFASVEHYCREHTNKSIIAAYNIIKATTEPSVSSEKVILDTKMYLKTAIMASQKATKNSQMVCILMNVMTDKFFRRIVGDQTYQSHTAGRKLAAADKNLLWTAVAANLFSDFSDWMGKPTDAEGAKRDGMEAFLGLPALVRKNITSGE